MIIAADNIRPYFWNAEGGVPYNKSFRDSRTAKGSPYIFIGYHSKQTGAHCAPLHNMVILSCFVRRREGEGALPYIALNSADHYALTTKNLLNRLLLLNFIETLAIHSKL